MLHGAMLAVNVLLVVALPRLPAGVSRRWWRSRATFFTGLRQLWPGCSPSLPPRSWCSTLARIAPLSTGRLA
jgi:hypothetical protein